MVLTDDQLISLVLSTKLIDEKGLAEVKKYAQNADVSLSDALLEKNIISDEYFGVLVSQALHIPFVRLSKLTIADEILHIVPERLARKHKVIAFSRDAHGINLAMTNPKDVVVTDLLKRKTGQTITPYYATERDINNTFHFYKKELQQKFNALLKKYAKKADGGLGDLPVAKIVDTLIDFAYQNHSSDLHVEPRDKDALVRFRIDGILHDMLFVPKDLHERIISRIKVMSRLRTDEHLASQDGKMRLRLEEETLDIRVSILPIVDGEKAVLRLLSSRSNQLSLVDLGMSESDLKKVHTAIAKPHGMILSTGPTGSGKSTSVYAILKLLNTREKNITTIEDPVEYRIKGVNQIHVNPKANLTFASGLRAILRQDPNIVLVGEIRDIETAGIAVNAALTGHMVLSTLHTNDASTALPRLIDMKVEPFLVASTIKIIIGQRLIRKLCENCKISYTTTIEELKKHLSDRMIQKHFIPIGQQNEVRFYKGQGCKLCHNTGYAGRIGVFEVLEVTNAIRTLITDKKDSDVIQKAAYDEGMTSMLDDGIIKVTKGLTTIEEVLRVTQVES
ncbi:MAG: GspE/PulE family protein [Patescibacteria group bacterium]